MCAFGCTAINDFGRFQIGGSDGGNCGTQCSSDHQQLINTCGSPRSCACIDQLGDVPAHCPPVISNNVPGCPDTNPDVVLAGGNYVIDSDQMTFIGPGVSLTGQMSGELARFCVRSLTTMPGRMNTLQINGPRAVAIIARDLFELDGRITMAGGDAMNIGGVPHGGGGRGGNTGSGGSPMLMSGGRAGGASASPGVGGGGGGNLDFGGHGGSVMGVPAPTINNRGNPNAGVGIPGGGGGGGTASPGGAGGAGGAGGGMLQVSAGARIVIRGEINATGGGGDGGRSGNGAGNGGGGGGGGAGGTLFFEAPQVSFADSAQAGALCISVYGGAGGTGGGMLTNGPPAMPRTACPFGSTPVTSAAAGSAGGDPESTTNYDGRPAIGPGGSGGGAGSPGKIMYRADNMPATTGIRPAASLLRVGPYTPP